MLKFGMVLTNRDHLLQIQDNVTKAMLNKPEFDVKGIMRSMALAIKINSEKNPYLDEELEPNTKRVTLIV